jgi:hypothetical protein
MGEGQTNWRASLLASRINSLSPVKGEGRGEGSISENHPTKVVPKHTKSAFATQICRGDPPGRPYLGLYANGLSRSPLPPLIRGKPEGGSFNDPLTHTLSPTGGEGFLFFSARREPRPPRASAGWLCVYAHGFSRHYHTKKIRDNHPTKVVPIQTKSAFADYF